MTGSTFRKLSRTLHIITAILLGAYIYSPWGADPLFSAVVMWVAVPLTTLTGVAMWKQGIVMNWLNANKRVAVNR